MPSPNAARYPGTGLSRWIPRLALLLILAPSTSSHANNHRLEALAPSARNVAASALLHQDAKRQVWVNPRSSVYHCPGTRYWGNTKSGLFMSEDGAIAKGHRPAYGKSCGLTGPVPDSSGAPRLQLVAPARPVTPADTVRVWVNTGSGVFHCPGSRYYGRTQRGRYLTRTEARAAGYRAAGGTACR
jgi:hypothetical protein